MLPYRQTIRKEDEISRLYAGRISGLRSNQCVVAYGGPFFYRLGRNTFGSRT